MKKLILLCTLFSVLAFTSATNFKKPTEKIEPSVTFSEVFDEYWVLQKQYPGHGTSDSAFLINLDGASLKQWEKCLSKIETEADLMILTAYNRVPWIHNGFEHFMGGTLISPTIEKTKDSLEKKWRDLQTKTCNHTYYREGIKFANKEITVKVVVRNNEPNAITVLTLNKEFKKYSTREKFWLLQAMETIEADEVEGMSEQEKWDEATEDFWEEFPKFD